MLKRVLFIGFACAGFLVAAYVYSQTLNTSSSSLAQEVEILKSRITTLEQRVGSLEQDNIPRIIPAQVK